MPDAPEVPEPEAVRPPGRWRRYRVPIVAYTAIATYLIVQQHVSNRVLRRHPYRWVWQGWHSYLDGWSQFDGPQYERIAAHGYSFTPGQLSRLVWFPLYPMLMRFLSRAVFHDYLITGVVISLVVGLGAACAYWRWLEAVGMRGRTRLVAFFVLALYPYGWYLYGAVHADALFLFLLVSAFVLIERDHLVWAGVVGALATASRPTGMGAIPALVVLALQHDGVLRVADDATGWVRRFALPLRFDRSRLRPATLAPALSAVGLGSYMAFQWWNWGSPIIFITNEQLYHPGGRPWLKTAFFWRLLHIADYPSYALTITGQALVALLVVLAVPGVCRRFGFAYGLFLALLVATPTLSTEDFMGTGRYLMAAFPAFAYAGERLVAAGERRPRLALGYLLASGALLAFLGFFFARSTYLT